MAKAYVLISCEVGTEQELHSKLLDISGVKSATITYGEYDIVAELETGREDEMNTLIMQKIRKLEKIRTTITLGVSS